MSANSNISSLNVVEESTSTYAVSLNAQPAADVTVTIAEATSGSYTDADITVASSKTADLHFAELRHRPDCDARRRRGPRPCRRTAAP